MSVRRMTMEEFLTHVTIQAVMLDFQWVYFPAPRLVLEQKNGLLFELPPEGTKWKQIFLV